ncbi:MAG: VRR-NUC domain-containing protein [Dehalococcoidia bacterium]|nr:MAG: VRR-NUC domain-containing protein [Dehalococcoidia bacterium]
MGRRDSDIVGYTFLSQSEESFQDRYVIPLAKMFGWCYYHTHNSRHSAEGFPDLVLVRPPRIIFAELKAKGKKPTRAQEAWLELLGSVPGVEVYDWTPDDADRIVTILER